MDFNKCHISPVLIISIFLMNFNCATSGATRYKFVELKEKREVYSNVLGKNVEVHKQNGDVITGFLQDVKHDSLIISFKEKQATKRIILAKEVKYIKVHKQDNLLLGTIIFAALVSTLVILIISISDFGEGISKAK